MSTKLRIKNWPRPTIQWGVILFLIILALMPKFDKNFVPDFEAYCPFGGIQALGSYLLNQALSCTMTSAQIVMGVLLMLAVFVFSKLFCAFICPIGTVSEWLGKLGDKLKIRFTIKGIADKALRLLKYALLFITLYHTLQSNELFCKKFDPYFGIASGFDTDVVVLWSVIAIVLVVLGSVFIRLFWCKYICPLGAISNIFKFTGVFVGIMVVYLFLLHVGVDVSYVWPLAIACIAGFVIEISGRSGKVFPIFKITRQESTCTNCQLCSRKCPQGIDVASLKVVTDVDCNLCGECVSVCPVNDTVQINKKKNMKWLPPVATIVLVVAGIFLGSLWEVPTIDQKWGDTEMVENLEVFQRSGLKNIKCYGSSMAFASKMKKVDGVLGVATYVKNKRVKIYYDADVLSNEKLEELIFTPSKTALRAINKEVQALTEVTVWMENFFDLYDFNYLARLLQQKTEAVGLISEYACPVKVKIYFPKQIQLNETELIEILESKSLTYQYGENENTVELKYEVAIGPEYGELSRKDYVLSLFDPYVLQFNDYKTFDSTVIKTVEVPMGKNSAQRKKLQYMVSHLSNDDGIIELRTIINDESKEMVSISYVDSMTNDGNVRTLLQSDTLTFTYSDGDIGKVKNMFNFK